MSELSPALGAPDAPASTGPTAGVIVIAAALAGIAWGVATQMVWPDEETA